MSILDQIAEQNRQIRLAISSNYSQVREGNILQQYRTSVSPEDVENAKKDSKALEETIKLVPPTVPQYISQKVQQELKNQSVIDYHNISNDALKAIGSAVQDTQWTEQFRQLAIDRWLQRNTIPYDQCYGNLLNDAIYPWRQCNTLIAQVPPIALSKEVVNVKSLALQSFDIQQYYGSQLPLAMVKLEYWFGPNNIEVPRSWNPTIGASISSAALERGGKEAISSAYGEVKEGVKGAAKLTESSLPYIAVIALAGAGVYVFSKK